MKPYLSTKIRKVTERLFYTDREVNVFRDNLYADYLFIYGKSLYGQKRYEAACDVMAQASVQYGKRLDITKNQFYIDCLLKADKFEQASVEMYRFIELGKINDEMKLLMQPIFHNRDVLNNAEAKQRKVLLDRIVTFFVDEKFDDLVLYDQNDSLVSTDQFKGKIIVLDFWASWCAPCMAGLDVLNEIKLKYSNDKDVEVVTINTLEKNIEGILRAKEFLKKRKYQFVQLYDKRNSTPGKVNFSSLPTRIIIDQYGRTRIRQSGMESSLAEQIVELNTMITLLKR